MVNTIDGKFESLLNRSTENAVASVTHNFDNLSKHYQQLVLALMLFSEEIKDEINSTERT